MSVRQKECFVTDDGKAFIDLGEATKHQANLDMRKWYVDSWDKAGLPDYNIKMDVMQEYLLANKDEILRFIYGATSPSAIDPEIKVEEK